MSGKTMSDWCAELHKARMKEDAKGLESNKIEDMRRLRNSGLPQFEYFDCSYSEFKLRNQRLMDFFWRNHGVCIRALPRREGITKGFTRKYAMGNIGFWGCASFLKENVREPKKNWDISLTEWKPNRYGFVLISGSKWIIGEIGKSLEKLSHGEENPLAHFEIRRGELGHITNKTKWKIRKDEDAAGALWGAFRYICTPSDNFDPYCRRGYFEGVVTERGDTKFLDYKISEAYLGKI